MLMKEDFYVLWKILKVFNELILKTADLTLFERISNMFKL